MNLLSGGNNRFEIGSFHFVLVAWLANSFEISLGQVIVIAIDDNTVGIYLEDDEGVFICCASLAKGSTVDKSEYFK